MNKERNSSDYFIHMNYFILFTFFIEIDLCPEI
ncbi:hypothetical protein QE357_005187 [Siphonobacter sp. BAB-5404]|nr:hypothetical protein [Siphonobacter sp. SORGH_AS_0500]